MTHPVRIDKWLWAARFFKSRGLAQAAVAGGKVHLNGQRVKPARDIKPGDELAITKGEWQFIVRVEGLAEKRGPATLAQQLYSETAAGIQAREQQRTERKQRPPAPGKRPDKRARRRIRSFTGKGL